MYLNKEEVYNGDVSGEILGPSKRESCDYLDRYANPKNYLHYYYPPQLGRNISLNYLVLPLIPKHKKKPKCNAQTVFLYP